MPMPSESPLERRLRLRDAAVNFFDSSNSLRFRRNGGADQMVMLVNPSLPATLKEIVASG